MKKKKKLSTKEIFGLLAFMIFIFAASSANVPFIYQAAAVIVFYGGYHFISRLIEKRKNKLTAEKEYKEQTDKFHS